jgi:hypothetical protein
LCEYLAQFGRQAMSAQPASARATTATPTRSALFTFESPPGTATAPRSAMSGRAVLDATNIEKVPLQWPFGITW